MSDAEYLKQMEIQRLAFEAQFGSLEDMGFDDKTKKEESESESESGNDQDESEDNNDDFDDGDDLMKYSEFPDSEEEEISEEEEEQDSEEEKKPVVITFRDTTKAYTPPTKEELKLLKSGKSSYKRQEPPKSKKQQVALGDSEENVQNDLELQRFLKESHILANFNNETSGAALTLSTIDSDNLIGDAKKHQLKHRLSSVSSTNKVAKTNLQKMPMSMRKGMIKSQMEKIAKFEKEAKDEGIVLSRVAKGKFRNIGGSLSLNERIGDGYMNEKKLKKSRFRDKGLDVSAKVGKSTRNGLIISQKDIDRINGAGKFNKKMGKKGGRR
ncbi:hypothetical protein WICPIJ_007365 [Wickerhamomyces pijperi]|uniref:Protein FAF1 n=1 Tax=Wickerhamomyces pijperi TaxID=599730 RepID=A0A9P8PZY7_WICPI|nr:hypothetical protein WICPIJ_007365 [Wickerhamomyces pijperi]